MNYIKSDLRIVVINGKKKDKMIISINISSVNIQQQRRNVRLKIAHGPSALSSFRQWKKYG